LQLSTENDAFLFRLNRIDLTPEIKNLLQDETITKVGAAIKDDLKGLKELSDFNPGGFVELQDYVKAFDIQPNGLKKIAAIVLGIRISKSQQVSNWENPSLTESQLLYAATDAWVCGAIYDKLLKYS
jgi:ribonuclease D